MKKKNICQRLQGDKIKNEVQTKQANFCGHFSTEQIQKYTTVTAALKTLQNPSPIHM